MFKLTDIELDHAFEAIKHHGYSALLPQPPEWKTVEIEWSKIRAHIAKLDLKAYSPFQPLTVYAPKSRYSLRVLKLLHPQDLLIYTALVLILKNDIEKARDPVSRRRVFSFRSLPAIPNQLYQGAGAYEQFRKRLKAKARHTGVTFVAVADVADFYPRIYQHRLENSLRNAASTERATAAAEVLVGRLAGKLTMSRAHGALSYGIPIGPLASRLLAEAIMIDVDAALAHEHIDYVRWVDDFAFFCKSERQAERCLLVLGEWLFEHHGLTLQTAKTKVVSVKRYREMLGRDYDARLTKKAKKVYEFFKDAKAGPYETADEVTLTPAEIAAADALPLQEALSNALDDPNRVDYELVELILGKLATLAELPREKKLELLNVVVAHVEMLYPVAESLYKFFLSLDNLKASTRRRIAAALLKPLRGPSNRRPPDYYSMWILNLFAHSPGWNHAEAILKIYKSTNSDVVRRYAALAIANNGKRFHALEVTKDYEGASPLLRDAILICSHLKGTDERGHWLKMITRPGELENLL